MTKQTPTSLGSVAPNAHEEALARFDQWIRPQLPFLRRFCGRYQMHGYCDADDLYQETVIRAFAAIDRFDGRHPRAWLVTIARNGAITMWRERSRQPTATFAEHAHGAVGEDWMSLPEAELLRRMPDPRLCYEIRRLPSHFRATVELVDVGGLSYRETADILQIPMGTVMSRLHRGRARLRRAFANAPSPAPPGGPQCPSASTSRARDASCADHDGTY